MNSILTREVPLTSAAVRTSQYQALKGRVHQELLNRLNLDKLNRMKREDALRVQKRARAVGLPRDTYVQNYAE